MRRTTGLTVGLAAGVMLLAGCGQEKELPKEITRSTVREEPVQAPIPASSDPAAKAVVERAIKAATDGHPERLEKFKAHKSVVKGQMVLDSGAVTATTRRVEAVWPDRMRASFEFPVGDRKQVLIGMRRPVIWSSSFGGDGRGTDITPADRQRYEEIVATDAIGQCWMPMLVPLIDPKTVVFDAKKEPALGQPGETVKVAVPGCPTFTLWFDEKTSHLGLVTYRHVEWNTPIDKRLTLAAHKPQGGIVLPTRIDLSRNGRDVEQWEVVSWESVDKIDDAAFDPPK
jgi:hypothetical protein